MAVTQERINELYQDAICKCYCSVETPSRTLELLNKNPGMTQMDALRQVITFQLKDAVEKGWLHITTEELDALCQDLMLGMYHPNNPHGSRNLKRINARYQSDAGMKTKKSKTINPDVTPEVYDEFILHAQLRGISKGRLATSIITAWVEHPQHKRELKNLKRGKR